MNKTELNKMKKEDLIDYILDDKNALEEILGEKIFIRGINRDITLNDKLYALKCYNKNIKGIKEKEDIIKKYIEYEMKFNGFDRPVKTKYNLIHKDLNTLSKMLKDMYINYIIKSRGN